MKINHVLSLAVIATLILLAACSRTATQAPNIPAAQGPSQWILGGKVFPVDWSAPTHGGPEYQSGIGECTILFHPQSVPTATGTYTYPIISATSAANGISIDVMDTSQYTQTVGSYYFSVDGSSSATVVVTDTSFSVTIPPITLGGISYGHGVTRSFSATLHGVHR